MCENQKNLENPPRGRPRKTWNTSWADILNERRKHDKDREFYLKIEQSGFYTTDNIGKRIAITIADVAFRIPYIAPQQD